MIGALSAASQPDWGDYCDCYYQTPHQVLGALVEDLASALDHPHGDDSACELPVLEIPIDILSKLAHEAHDTPAGFAALSLAVQG